MKISIITVAYNSGQTIADTIHSVSNQLYEDYEHLVIDGVSQDSTVNIAQALEHPKLKIFTEPDEGIYDAMNKGFARASGEIIGFLNSDDVYMDMKALTRIAAAFQDETVEACYADLVYVTQDDKRVVRHWKSKRFEKGDFSKGWCPAHPTFYIRKSALERLGSFDLSFKLASDVEFMMRYLERGGVKFAYIPNILVRMRVGGVTNKNWSNVVKQNKEVCLALQKNDVSFCIISFWIHKLFSRTRQYLAARLVKLG